MTRPAKPPAPLPHVIIDQREITDEDAVAEIKNGLMKHEGFRSFEAESGAMAHIAARLAALRAREREDANPRCDYCGIRALEHDVSGCLVFAAPGSL